MSGKKGKNKTAKNKTKEKANNLSLNLREESNQEESTLNNDTKENNEIEEKKNVTKNLIVYLNLITNVKTINDEDEIEDNCICIPNYTPQNMLKKNEKRYEENEVIPEVSVEVDSENRYSLSDLIMKLKQYGYPLKSSIVYYYDEEIEEFINCGCDPIEKSVFLILQKPDKNNKYHLKLKCHSFLEFNEGDNNIMNNTTTPGNTNNKVFKNIKVETKNEEKGKRTKERKIGFIIDKVNTWRQLYNGFYDDYGNFIKYSLEDGAEIIDMCKKSLDDYLLQLRLGRKYGFDFNAKKDEKVGELRKFNKQSREKNKDNTSHN